MARDREKSEPLRLPPMVSVTGSVSKIAATVIVTFPILAFLTLPGWLGERDQVACAIVRCVCHPPRRN